MSEPEEAAGDWYDEWRARLAAGDDSPLPYDPAWWDRWEAALREAPDW